MSEQGKNVLILRMRSVSAMDIRGWMLLKRSLANVNEQPYHIMEKASFIDRVGADNFCANIDVALTRAASLEK
ncbi:hypothetical protein [Streptococcus anginosus]|uniref:hypothetical protein n=1 Tax=Streptococcus anginosus TaxID=1328 RepID=UPI0005B4507C|nr:hypothetical protein [Streptococcus anginosus]QQT10085.1 hypothetical protein I6J12_07135 [Streptococcus anginosus]